MTETKNPNSTEQFDNPETIDTTSSSSSVDETTLTRSITIRFRDQKKRSKKKFYSSIAEFRKDVFALFDDKLTEQNALLAYLDKSSDQQMLSDLRTIADINIIFILTVKHF